MLRKIIIGLGVVAVMLMVVTYFIYNKPHRSVDKADTSVDAVALVAAFVKNEEEANKNYLDKVVEVKGKVKEVTKKENAYVILLGDDASMSSVNCTLDHGQDALASRLKPGDETVIRGHCTGYLLDVVIINCKFVNVPE